MVAILSGAIAAMIVATLAIAGAEPNQAASCVGQFSRFFAQGGFGTHRSAVATSFAHEARPAGQNVYSHVAELHGSLDGCWAQV